MLTFVIVGGYPMSEYTDVNGRKMCDVTNKPWAAAQHDRMVADNIKAINASYNNHPPTMGFTSAPTFPSGSVNRGAYQGGRPIGLLKVYLLLVMAIACIGFAGKFVIFMYGEISSKLPPAPAVATSTKVKNAHPKKHLKPTNPTYRLP